MIEASFDRGRRSAAVSGVYQYDTGQRLSMHGLPSPQELAEIDELIGGGTVTVQAQFSYEGDSQTEPRLAEWDEIRGVWLAAIPDEYLTRSENVHVYVEVYYGEDEAGERTKTCYEGVFRPIGRPASNDTATDDQLAAWAAMGDEVELALASAGAATGNAQSRTQSAQTATQEARAAADSAQRAADAAQAAQQALAALDGVLGGMTVRAVPLAAGSAATATIDGNVLTYGVPGGARGAKGDTGDTGPADMTLSFSGGILTITTR